MALLTTQQITRAGTDPATGAVAAGGTGDEFVPGDNVFLRVVNGGGGATTVTVTTPRTVKGQAIADLAVSVPAGGQRLIGPLPADQYANPADGKGDVACSPTTSVTISVLELARD
jgi:hypothetical protein